MQVQVDVVAQLDDRVVRHARQTMAATLAPDQRDDRFSDRWSHDVRRGGQPFLAALCGPVGAPLGFLGGVVDRGRLRLDALVAPSAEADEAEVLDQLLRQLLPHGPQTGAGHLELWGHPALDYHVAVARAHDLVEVRALHQLRCPLPVAADPLPSRAFRPGLDDDAVVAVNNRAFASHPDQGGLTVEAFRAQFDLPWFDPEGLRVHEQDGRIVGFCWTKIHRDPDLGEIYVIGIDPDWHGQGLGVPMTAAGLHWLAQQGLTTGMLYVEADNAPAIRTYDKLGFQRWRTDRAWAVALG